MTSTGILSTAGSPQMRFPGLEDKSSQGRARTATALCTRRWRRTDLEWQALITLCSDALVLLPTLPMRPQHEKYEAGFATLASERKVIGYRELAV